MSGGSSRLTDDYWRLRDFEYAQPLYDLAFFLEIEALASGQQVPKYRKLALWKAALHLDGYGTKIDRWLDGNLGPKDLDHHPSTRIRGHLRAIRDNGCLSELDRFYDEERYQRCLRLRSLRGLGPKQIAQTLDLAAPAKEWLKQASLRTNLTVEELSLCFTGKSYRTWQPAHVVPPLLRFLHAVEEELAGVLRWNPHGIHDFFDPLEGEITVIAIGSDEPTLQRACSSALKQQRMFSAESSKRKSILRVRHVMGWAFSVVSGGDMGNAKSASHLATSLDPLSNESSGRMKSDLHLHTFWSDGAASLADMASEGQVRGYEYIAVTDHSRSSKLQSGLKPVDWIRQANSIALGQPVIPILHGIEVDIDRNGGLDLPNELLLAADFVVASVHSSWSENAEENTLRLVNAIESGCIDVIGHPTSALLGKPGVPDYKRPPVTLHWNQVFDRCARWQVALEFNCFPSRFDLSLTLLREALHAGCWISFGSDAHARSHMIHLRFGEEILHRLATKKVLNLFSYRKIRTWLSEAMEHRKTLERTIETLTQGEFGFTARSNKVTKVPAKINRPQRVPNGARIVGLDLTGSERKATGVAVLEGSRVETCSLYSDDDLLQFIEEKKPRIVSIDSPLGLPGGGDQINPAAGIVRVAEQDLSSIGIPAYPALIDSMKALTLRGMHMRNRIQSLACSPTVIESYPGAAQDILCIPRKQKSLRLLRDGLKELGVTGPGLHSTSHDEIDAITSAIVGRFFEAGSFEPMGVLKEAQLIVPKVQPLGFSQPPVICLAGKTGAGKSVVARYLAVYYGFHWIKTRDIIRTLLLEDAAIPRHRRIFGGQVNPDAVTEQDLRDFGALILDKYQQAPLRKKLAAAVGRSDTPIVVDAVRDQTDVNAARLDKRPCFLWFIDCSDIMIQSRLQARSKAGAKTSPFSSPVDKTASVLRHDADRIVPNVGTLEDLRWKVDDELFSLVEIEK